MAGRREIRSVEWLEEHAIGHSTAYREGGKVYVEVRVGGSVLLDGKEHIVDAVVTVEAEKRPIPGAK